MLCAGRALDRITNAPHGRGKEAWRILFQAYSQENNARLVVMMLEVLACPSDMNYVLNSLETMERKIKEFDRHANVQIPEFLKIGVGKRTDEDAPHHEFAQVGDHSHQAQGDERQSRPSVR